MSVRPRPEQLVELWNLTTMPTENVLFWQSYVDDKIGLDGKPLCSAIVALLVDDPDVFSDMHRPGWPQRAEMIRALTRH